MTIPLRITHIVEEAPQAKTFWLEPPHPIPYRAGQYLTLLHPRHPELRRSYSLSSAPEVDRGLAITLRRVDNGLFSRWLIDEAAVGNEVLTLGAGGLFTLPQPLEVAYEQLLLFAAGSGITPIFSLLKSFLHTRPAVSILLIYSNRTPQDAIFLRELRELMERYPERLHIEFLFSNHRNLAQARLYKDLLVTLVRQHATTTPAHMLAYVCGPLDYMRMCNYGLHAVGLSTDRIRRENFVLPPPTHAALPPDTATHTVLVEVGGYTHHVPVSYPDTILRAARQHSLVLPYSCEAGVCGNCVARCVSGEVWLSYNEVLTERDIAQGLTLTCVGHPIGGDVHIRV
ncbi:ferredoxin--NADP reductase [Hymenobacter wooponensis]|uniref:Ferredoxin--NADP reductase n=1 Tax=Hymenobacter wooponensis TaxID=1525360 RepID=A0A4Z0MG74_9BACT|nr:ferredoxin--NADP reductase [Hymenobacter wooponensis]TGD78772.1 ferredoxin--NADP reductase [Hymenobacter wooponensis]